MNEDELFDHFLEEYVQLAASSERITFDLTPLEAWCLLSQVQLASRHPQNIGPTRDIAEHVVRRLQDLITASPALRIIAERGWNPNYDEPRSTSHEEKN